MAAEVDVMNFINEDEGTKLALIVRNPRSYGNLCRRLKGHARLIGEAVLAVEEGRPVKDQEMAAFARRLRESAKASQAYWKAFAL